MNSKLPEPFDIEVTSSERAVIDLQRFAATSEGREALNAEIARRLRTETAASLAAQLPDLPSRKARREQQRRLLKTLTKARRAKA